MIEVFLILLVVILIVLLFFIVKSYFSLREDFDALRYSKASQSVKYGLLTEQWIPFSSEFPYNSQNFRFIGKPIDGLAFEDDKIVFVEFKTASSGLSPVQKKIRDLVKAKKVEWFELKIK